MLFFCAPAYGTTYREFLPHDLVRYTVNPDSSCVQCSGVIHGFWMNDPPTYTLLWNTKYGPRELGGSYPSRVAKYARERGMKIWNVTGPVTWDWLRWAGFSYPFNLTWLPAATCPCGFTSEGLPVGLQIVAGRFKDLLVLQASRAFERARPWADKHPAL